LTLLSDIRALFSAIPLAGAKACFGKMLSSEPFHGLAR
jgi:hypothetical protein